MEKIRRRVRFCLLFVVIVAVAVGVLYYYGEMHGQTTITEGTLISALGMELRQLCR